MHKLTNLLIYFFSYNNNQDKHDKIPLNTDDHSIKNDESPLSSSTTHEKGILI
jgi:hypothetical protein